MATLADDPNLWRVLEWLATADAPPVPGCVDVPGASAAELSRLTALGSLVRALTDRPDFHDQLTLLRSVPQIDSWLGHEAEPPKEVLEAATLVAADSELIAALYSSTVAPAHRRRLGTFFTPSGEVTRMLEACTAEAIVPRTVVDVGAGVGIFSIAAAQVWPDASVVAVDVNPVTLGLLGLRAAVDHLLAAGTHQPGVSLRLQDFIDYVGDGFQEETGPRLVLGNPPYTRLQLLPRGDRERLLEAAAGLCGSRASLSALMTAAALQRLGPADALCLLLPAQWLEADYAAALRERIWGERSRAVRMTLYATRLFKEAHVDAVSLLIGPVRSNAQTLTMSLPDADFVESWREGKCPSTWRTMFPSEDECAGRSASSFVETAPLSSVARVTRGVATGANEFFVLTAAQLGGHPLPKSVQQPLVRRLRDHRGDAITKTDLESLPIRDRRRLFVVDASTAGDDAVAEYIALGKKRGYPRRYLCSHRSTWYDLSAEVRVPDVIVGPSSKGAFRFVENEASAYITNNLYGMTWHLHVPPAARRAVLAWLRSAEGQAVVAARARSQGGRLLKIEPRALQGLPIPRHLVPGPPQPTLWPAL